MPVVNLSCSDLPPPSHLTPPLQVPPWERLELEDMLSELDLDESSIAGRVRVEIWIG